MGKTKREALEGLVDEFEKLEAEVYRLKEQRRADREALGFPGEEGVKPDRTEYAPEMGVLETLAYVGTCAAAWEPRVRLLGNAQAGDIRAACSGVASMVADLRSELAATREARDEWERRAHEVLVERNRLRARYGDDDLGGPGTGIPRW